LVGKGLQVNQIAQSGGTAVMFAAGGGHNETTAYLIEQGADVNVVVQATPGYIERVAKLIAEGKDEVEPHKDGVTALSVAAQGGHFGPVKQLVEAGAVVDIADEDDVTPLLAAVKVKNNNITMYLLEHGANPNDVFIDDKMKPHNILMDAVVESNVTLAVLLIEKGASIGYADDEGVTIITQAAYQGQESVVRALLDKGADPTAVNMEGINALIAAASEGHSEVVALLLESNKLDINAKDKDGTNALMAAAVRGHKGVIAQLIAKGADIDAQNVDGHTALMFAYNGKNQVETLLDKYSDYMRDVNDDSTKIIRDALETHIQVVELLIRSGANAAIQVCGRRKSFRYRVFAFFFFIFFF
jgi:serine/threonine-protein phosphatase 6 regulatory ankyrin repeat subunit B